MKIPKDVSALRRKFAQAIVAKKRGAVPVKKETVPTDDRVKKAREEAIKSRQQLREKMKNDAEKDARIQELQTALDEANAKLNEFEPAAKRWNEYSHKEKEIMIAKLPKEMHRDARDMDIKHLKLLVSNHTGEGATTTTGGAAKGTKIASLKDAEKAEPAAYNEFMDGIKKGTIKIDSEGLVVA